MHTQIDNKKVQKGQGKGADLVQGSYILAEMASQGRQVLLLQRVCASQVGCHSYDSNEGVVLEL